VSCHARDTYKSQLERELNSNIRNDSLFFDIHFGDTKKDFFNTCWEYNKKGILFHGSKNMNVQYTIKAPNDSVSKIAMLFYPDFDYSPEIRKMDIEFSFTGWALWNDHLFADKLLPYVKNIVSNWYGGNDFLKLRSKDEQIVWAKIDGNREVLIWAADGHYVKMRITDKRFETDE